MERRITRLHLHEQIAHLTSKEEKTLQLLKWLKGLLLIEAGSEKEKELDHFIKLHFFNPYFKRWDMTSRNNSRFLAKYQPWLSAEISFPKSVYMISSSSGVGRGRRQKSFNSSSTRVKRRKTEGIRDQNTSSSLAFATSMKLRSEGQTDAAKLISEVTTTSPQRATKIISTCKSPRKIAQMAPDVALGLLITLNLTRHQYTMLRRTAIEHGHDLYPLYDQVLSEKTKMYPHDIAISEKKCEVPLQALLDKTTEQIFSCEPAKHPSLAERQLTLYCKWGFDGSSSHSQYKQTFADKDTQDNSVFVTSLVPLRLIDDDSASMVGKNPRPSSPRYCRPIRLQWITETTLTIQNGKKYIEGQIQTLSTFPTEYGIVKYKMMFTMIDGKAQEAKNKEIRPFREFHTRKSSRINTNGDLFRRLLLSSDPELSGLINTSRSRSDMDPDAASLLNI